jgi:hypothetical protein
MKLFKKSGPHFSLAALCVGLTGCASPQHSVVTPVGGGYEEVAHPTRASMSQPETMRISFLHRAPDGKTTLIWPSLYGVGEVINGDVAIFVGDKAYVSSDPNDPRGMKPRLFAVRSPALPLDITDEILSRWSKASGKDLTKAGQFFSLVTPGEINGQLGLQLEFYTDETDWPDKSTVLLGWDQVFAIMREVREKGAPHKDLRWGTLYIEK